MCDCDANVTPKQKGLATETLHSPRCEAVRCKVSDTDQICACSWSKEGARSKYLLEDGVAIHIDNIDSCKLMDNDVHNVDPLTLYVSLIGYEGFFKRDLFSCIVTLGLIFYLLGDLCYFLRMVYLVNFADSGLSIMYVILLQTEYRSVRSYYGIEAKGKKTIHENRSSVDVTPSLVCHQLVYRCGYGGGKYECYAETDQSAERLSKIPADSTLGHIFRWNVVLNHPW